MRGNSEGSFSPPNKRKFHFTPITWDEPAPKKRGRSFIGSAAGDVRPGASRIGVVSPPALEPKQVGSDSDKLHPGPSKVTITKIKWEEPVRCDHGRDARQDWRCLVPCGGGFIERVNSPVPDDRPCVVQTGFTNVEELKILHKSHMENIQKQLRQMQSDGSPPSPAKTTSLGALEAAAVILNSAMAAVDNKVQLVTRQTLSFRDELVVRKYHRVFGEHGIRFRRFMASRRRPWKLMFSHLAKQRVDFPSSFWNRPYDCPYHRELEGKKLSLLLLGTM